MWLCAAFSGAENPIPGASPGLFNKAVFGRCKVGSDAPVEFQVNARVGRLHPVASLGFLAEQGMSLLNAFAQTNSLAFELLAELQGGADG